MYTRRSHTFSFVFLAVTCDGRALDHTNAATLTSGTEGASEAYGSQIVYTCDSGFSGSLTFTCGDSGFLTSDSCAGRRAVDDMHRHQICIRHTSPMKAVDFSPLVVIPSA
jgi:hypothetical protein